MHVPKLFSEFGKPHKEGSMSKILLQFGIIATVFMLSACTSTIRQANYDLYKGRLQAQSYLTGKRYQTRPMISYSKAPVTRVKPVVNRQQYLSSSQQQHQRRKGITRTYQRPVVRNAKAAYTYHRKQPQPHKANVVYQRPHPVARKPYQPQTNTVTRRVIIPQIPITQLNERLFKAAKSGNMAQLNLLLKQGAQINATNANRETALHAAAALGQYAAVRLLLQQGANPNATTSNGWTPLHSAARFRHPQIAKLLVTRGSHINATNKQGKTAVALATQVGANTTANMLMALGGY